MSIKYDQYVSNKIFKHAISNACKFDKLCILANPETKDTGTNGRNIFKNMNIPEFPIHYYRQIFAKIGTHDKIASSFFSHFLGST